MNFFVLVLIHFFFQVLVLKLQDNGSILELIHLFSSFSTRGARQWLHLKMLWFLEAFQFLESL